MAGVSRLLFSGVSGLAFLVLGPSLTACGEGSRPVEASEGISSSTGGSAEDPSTGGFGADLSTGGGSGGSKDDIDFTPPMGDGSLAQNMCIAPWDANFSFSDQYIALTLSEPQEVGQTFYIRSEDPVPAAIYTAYDIPEGCRLPEDTLGSLETITAEVLCLTLTLGNAEAAPVENVLLHVGAGTFITTKFFPAESCP